ncbi:substrate-binding domain-containing protein [Sulfuricurvum sp.]|uniref:ABC transporter substrate-binding protein n=1 Tax=Sulfuricurvum sp. TaxID=2025608 RepID=UPI002E320AE5|nr:substrate-binding domain-containing protein [Sulfuricurvum sp.]HEX5329376.1 substrate-binding domain-containing protein [Sulfuricurvum sp.]
MGKIAPNNLLIYVLTVFFLIINGNASAADRPNEKKSTTLTEMQQIVAKASERASNWDGPTTGPIGVHGMRVAVVCEDLRNGGVLGVAKGLGEASDVLGWEIKILDARGSISGRNSALETALAMKPDGVILLGSDAHSLESRLVKFKKEGIPVVGWHVGPNAGKLASGSVAMNVSTDPYQVARVTAMKAVVESHAKAGVIIFTDSNFAIAMSKANAMAKIIQECPTCTLLEIRRVPISQSAQQMPKITRELLKRYGSRWTHSLAINDIYFDYASPEFTKTGRDIRLFSAGDGSPAAFMRIQAKMFQYGTVAEPLNLQGWQLADELNRLLSHQSVSGYVMNPHLVTPENIAYDGGKRMEFDPDNGYRKIYRRIWKR